MSALRRLAALGLLAAAYAPLHRLLDPNRTGPAGASTRAVAEGVWSVGLAGTLIVLTFAWVVVRMTGAEGGKRPWIERAPWLLAPSDRAASIGAGVIAFALSAWIAHAVHLGAPTSVDEMVQLAHARALAHGRLGIPAEGSAAAVALQNGIVTPEGWVSIYPPFHTLMLTLGVLLGVPWLVGPFMTGVATAAATALTQRATDALTGRVLGLLLIVSPFWLVLGATHLSHTTAAAGTAVSAYALLRARDERSLLWAVLAGAAIGVAVGARPWVGLASALAFAVYLWRSEVVRAPARTARFAAAVLLGGLPFAALLMVWNLHLFGSPLRLGYSAAFGPAHGLGLHDDPWGNSYGVVEAVAYSGADLMQLGIRLLESPLPLLGLIGLTLLLRPIGRGLGLFGVWCAVAVFANALYWHHGVHFGPRMLFESTPAWLTLFASLVAASLRTEGSETRSRFTRAVVAVTLVGGIVLLPSALRQARGLSVPALPDVSAGSTVFVHGAWASRVSSRLVAAGMRRDSIETALRRNDLCAVDLYARSPRSASDVDFDPLPGSPEHLAPRTLSPGNVVRVDPRRAPAPPCIREARSDRLGVLELEVVAWRTVGDPGGTTFVRDLGPALNAAVLEARPGPAWLLVDRGEEVGLHLLEYADGMELLWGGAAGR